VIKTQLLGGRKPRLAINLRRRRCDKIRLGIDDSIEDAAVPTISMFYGILIRMYFGRNEHAPAHFHAYYQDHEASIGIDTGEVLKGSLPQRQLKLVLAWSEIRREELLADWRLIMNGERPLPIDPLR
jgi:hypothetical protein